MKFRVTATEYTEQGALTDIVHSYIFDSPETALEQFKVLNAEYFYDEDGNRTGIKKYRMVYQCQSWKTITDPVEFCKQFES